MGSYYLEADTITAGYAIEIQTSDMEPLLGFKLDLSEDDSDGYDDYWDDVRLTIEEILPTIFAEIGGQYFPDVETALFVEYKTNYVDMEDFNDLNLILFLGNGMGDSDTFEAYQNVHKDATMVRENLDEILYDSEDELRKCIEDGIKNAMKKDKDVQKLFNKSKILTKEQRIEAYVQFVFNYLQKLTDRSTKFILKPYYNF